MYDGGLDEICVVENVLCLLNVRCWWILCGIYVFGSVQVMLISTIYRLCGMLMCLFCFFSCTCTDMPLGASGILL